MFRMIPLILLLFTPITALAVDVQPTARVYEPIVIKHVEGSKVQILPWGGTVPKFLDETYIKRDWPEHTVFAAPPGAYIVFGDGGMGIIIIEGTPVPPLPPPTDPPTDPDPPIPTQVQEVSRSGAVRLNDPTTTADLITAMNAAVDQVRTLPVETQVASIRTAIETTLLNRKGDSRQKNWLELWRKPVNAAMQASHPDSQYIALVEAAIAGLKQAHDASSQEKTQVHMWVTTGDPCIWCDKWNNEVYPFLKDRKDVVIEFRKASHPGVLIPQFELKMDGKEAVTHMGFMTLDQFNGIVNTLRR